MAAEPFQEPKSFRKLLASFEMQRMGTWVPWNAGLVRRWALVTALANLAFVAFFFTLLERQLRISKGRD